MSTFEQLGKTLDKLVGSENVKLAMQLIENFAHPVKQVKIDSQVNNIQWINAYSRTPRNSIKLNRNNAQAIINWMVDVAGFDFAEPLPEGIMTDCGHINWDEWLVKEDHEAVVFYNEEQFCENYFIEK